MIFKWAKKTQLFCFLIGLVCALPFIILTPPFQVTDEPQHFYRAFQISELNVLPESTGKIAGGTLPSSLIELSTLFLDTREIHVYRKVVSRPWSFLEQGFAIPLAAEQREFIDFSGAAFYSPLPYIPQAAAIVIGRTLGLDALQLVYLARLVNAVLAIYLVALAVQRTPVFKAGFLVAGLLPMSLYLYASLSPDALVIGTAFLFTALSIEAYFNKRWTTPDLAIAIICGTIFCSIKTVYAPLLLISLAGFFHDASRSRALATQLALIGIPLIVTATWLHSVSGMILPVWPGTNVGAQLEHVLRMPLMFVAAMLATLQLNFLHYYQSAIGKLGWMNLPLSPLIYSLPILAVGISIFSIPRVDPLRSNRLVAWWACLAMGCVALILLALYLYWSVVKAYLVDGVQGRYFIPMLPLCGVVLAGMVARVDLRIDGERALASVAGLAIVSALLTLHILAGAYWHSA
ncbi:MAG: DUF2142 domain-containing protein [Pseudomonadota bacterium]